MIANKLPMDDGRNHRLLSYNFINQLKFFFVSILDLGLISKAIFKLLIARKASLSRQVIGRIWV
jgi:hypothetical protein